MNIKTVTTTTIKLSNTILKNKNLKGKFKGMSARNLKARSYVSLSRKPKSCWWPLRPACWPLSPSLISPLSPLPLLTPQFHKTLLSQHARCSYSTGFGSSGPFSWNALLADTPNTLPDDMCPMSPFQWESPNEACILPLSSHPTSNPPFCS